MKWIDTSDLELWASKPAAKSDLALLVSRLIRATTTKLTNLSIPKGKSTNRGGWDGIVISSEVTEFVPAGVSLWEFGTTGNAKGKADKDYEKRTTDPHGYDIGDATFVFITPQVWEQADEWVKEKKKESKWKDIKVYNGSKLEEWLSIAPLQSYWLAKEIGRAPNDGIESAEDFWENWKTGPEYVLQPEVVTTGRKIECDKLTTALQSAACVISIQASSRDEAIAFVIGSIMQLDTEIQESILSRSVIVESEGSFKTLVANNDELVLIAKLESSNALHRAVAKGHFVILPLGPDEQFSGGVNLVLPRLHRDGFTDALVKLGVSKEKAQALSKESSRNITILRRLEKFDFDKPKWANGENVRDIIPALLVGKWDESKEYDKKVVSAIANEPYDTYIAKLVKWKHKQGTPIYQIGSKWRISSSLDIWSHIAKYITSADLDRFKQTLLQVIHYIKPMMDLEPKQRYMAALYGKETEYSGWAREGLVQSLILIAVYGDEFKMVTPQGGQVFADNIVYILLKEANSDLWCSVNDIMPLIAEASPTSFLSGVENSLSGKNPIIASVFNEVDNGISPTSYHTGLLWALESLAWMPESLSRVSLIFAQLASIDPGGRLSNRPANSLIQIYLHWHPQTYATLDQRLQILQALAGKYPHVTWNLLLKLLPQHHGGVGYESHKCRWRKFNYTEPVVTYPELFKSYSDTLTLCLSIVGYNVDKIVQLLAISDAASKEDNNRILGYIKNNANNIIDTDHKVWAELRKTIGHHRSFPTAQWAWPEAQLTPYVELHDLFTPKSTVELYKWLFQDQWPTFPDGDNKNIDQKEEEIIKRRIETLQAMEKEVGIQGIVDLLPQLLPYVTGDTLGRLIETEEKLHEIFGLLNGDDKVKKETLYAVLYRVYFLKGFQWIINLYETVNNETKDAKILANILIPLPQSKEVWDFVVTTTEEVQGIYWLNFNPWFGGLDNAYKEMGMQKLIAAERFGSVIRQLSSYASGMSTETIYNALASAATKPSADQLHIDYYSITRVFEELDKRGDLDDKRMSQLEFYYLAYLTSYGSNRKPKLIHKELSTSPESLVELLKWVYKANTDEQNEAEKEDKEKNPTLPMAGYRLLDSWETIPGSEDNQNIDYHFLENWIGEVRNLAQQIGLIEVADMEIAKILACYKIAGDGNWPSDGICKIIDGINTKSIRDNFHAAIYNNRGTTSRGVFDGGEQERELSAYFKTLAKKHALKWPITAAILDDLAKEYEMMGQQEDRQALEMDLDY